MKGGVDTNILVYAHRQDDPNHPPSLQNVTALAEGASPWAIPWPCIHEFLAVVTQPAVMRRPSPYDRAIADIEAILSSPTLMLIGETDGHWSILRELLATSRPIGRAVHDAKIAAICLQHGVTEFWTAYHGFSRFAGLRVINPLAAV